MFTFTDAYLYDAPSLQASHCGDDHGQPTRVFQDTFFLSSHLCILPRKLTWNLKMEIWKKMFLFNWGSMIIFRTINEVHVYLKWPVCFIHPNRIFGWNLFRTLFRLMQLKLTWRRHRIQPGLQPTALQLPRATCNPLNLDPHHLAIDWFFVTPRSLITSGTSWIDESLEENHVAMVLKENMSCFHYPKKSREVCHWKTLAVWNNKPVRYMYGEI